MLAALHKRAFMTNGTLDHRNPIYLDELAPGRRFTTQRYTLDEADLTSFAAQFDPQPFHLDAEAARHSVFGGLVASGWYTAAITMRLLVTSGLPIAGGMVGLGGEISWPRPTRAGDVLHVDSEILAVKPTRRGDRGVVTLRSETCNERGEAVQIFTAKLLVPCRPASGSASLAS
jgi:acyl dehydratase